MTNANIITGQYVKINQTPANLGERFLARLIDCVIIVLYVGGTITVVMNTTSFSYDRDWVLYLFLFIIYLPVWGYSFLFELFNDGQTPGKQLMNIKVVMTDGSTPSISSYLLRWLLFSVDFIITGGLGVLFILLGKKKQRIGDLAAGTMVIRINEYKRIKVSLDEYKHLSEDYRPVYPQAADLSFEQVNIIKKVLEMKNNKRSEYISQLSLKLKEMLRTNGISDDELFLRTIMKDYEYYAYVEV